MTVSLAIARLTLVLNALGLIKENVSEGASSAKIPFSEGAAAPLLRSSSSQVDAPGPSFRPQPRKFVDAVSLFPCLFVKRIAMKRLAAAARNAQTMGVLPFSSMTLSGLLISSSSSSSSSLPGYDRAVTVADEFSSWLEHSVRDSLHLFFVDGGSSLRGGGGSSPGSSSNGDLADEGEYRELEAELARHDAAETADLQQREDAQRLRHRRSKSAATHQLMRTLHIVKVSPHHPRPDSAAMQQSQIQVLSPSAYLEDLDEEEADVDRVFSMADAESTQRRPTSAASSGAGSLFSRVLAVPTSRRHKATAAEIKTAARAELAALRRQALTRQNLS